MKRVVIKASAMTLDEEKTLRLKTRKADRILQFAQKLLDEMEDTPAGFLDANDLDELYEVLLDTIQDFSYRIERGDIEVPTGIRR